MNIIPTLPEIGKETLTVLCGLILAALILNQFPALKAYVSGASITLKDSSGRTLV